MKGTVFVAMSGGVDSSLTAFLLREQGYEVIGATMLLSGSSTEKGSAAEDARRVAEWLGIQHHVFDFRELFRTRVIDYFLKEYAEGRTPNPCVMCNRYVKFGELFQKGAELGADHFATGHYARVERDSAGRYRLRKGADPQKDQSYVLFSLTSDVLSRLLLPLGDIGKEETRAMAEKFGIPVAHKPDSQEICFVPQDDYKAYLKKYLPECLQKGEITDLDGNVLGHHEGVPLYTIGQRKGLGIAAPDPLYVVRLDTRERRVTVGSNQDVFASELTADDLRWMLPEKFSHAGHLTAKIRYGKREAACDARMMEDGRHIRVTFHEPQRAITPGQFIVFYDGEYVLGGGVIESVK